MTPTILLTIYITVSLIIASGGALWIGYTRHKRTSSDTVNSVALLVYAILLWPLVPPIVLLVLPFYGLYRLGKRLS